MPLGRLNAVIEDSESEAECEGGGETTAIASAVEIRRGGRGGGMVLVDLGSVGTAGVDAVTKLIPMTLD